MENPKIKWEAKLETSIVEEWTSCFFEKAQDMNLAKTDLGQTQERSQSMITN
jgi:hypothetical protein